MARILYVALLAVVAAAQQPNPAFAPIEDDPTLPRVLLIGDSISIGYTLETRRLLAGKANLHRIPTNGGPTTRGLENIETWLGDGRWDVIHFNWGLHDLKYMEDGAKQVAPEDYRRNLARLVERLEQTGARLIWASTTPIPPAETNPPRYDKDVVLYNQIAAEIMAPRAIPTDDLYQAAFERLADIQRPANVHFTPEGSKYLANHVASAVTTALPAD